MSEQSLNIISEPPWARRVLIFLSMLVAILFLVLPLAAVFFQAFSQGWQVYWTAVNDPDVMAAVRLTLFTAALVVPINAIFGLSVAWLICRFDFKGRKLILTLVDTPLAVSPVIAGMIFILLLGSRGLFGPWLAAFNLQVIFSTPGIIIVTAFITTPFIARELIPLMQEQGSVEEEAALTLGAKPWQMYLWVTLPKLKWGLLYGLILCNARAMGEFGAVSVVSGHIRGQTNTLPLEVEILYNEYQFAAAFAAASLLTLLAFVTLAGKSLTEKLANSQPRKINNN